MKYRTVFLVIALLLSGVMHAQNHPTAWWQSPISDSISAIPSIVFEDSMVYVDSIEKSELFTVISTYCNQQVPNESAVWHLMVNDSAMYGLTTQSIRSGHLSMRYRPYRTTGPIISTIQMTIPEESVAEHIGLYVGAMGDLPSTVGLSEVMCYNMRLSTSQSLSIQSYMAIKYGAMLGKVDYLDGHQNVVWDYARNRQHHHRIAGVATDSTYGLIKTHGHNLCDSSLLTIISDTLKQGEYILAGDDNGALSFEETDGTAILNRTWKVQTTAVTDDLPMVDIILDTALIPHAGGDSLYLVIDDQRYAPTRMAGGLCYRHIMIPADTAYIHFAKGMADEPPALTQRRDEQEEAGVLTREHTSINVYPNPNKGQYCIMVSNAQQAEVEIYDAKGRLVKTYYGTGSMSYSFNGRLPQGQTYFVSVRADGTSQTLKMIVE